MIKTYESLPEDFTLGRMGHDLTEPPLACASFEASTGEESELN